MRPPSLFHYTAEDLLEIYLQTALYLKAQKNCNQFYIAQKIKEDFKMCDDMTHAHPQITAREVERLADKYKIPDWRINLLASYICRSTPAAIVQMCKRIRKQVQN